MFLVSIHFVVIHITVQNISLWSSTFFLRGTSKVAVVFFNVHIEFLVYIFGWELFLHTSESLVAKSMRRSFVTNSLDCIWNKWRVFVIFDVEYLTRSGTFCQSIYQIHVETFSVHTYSDFLIRQTCFFYNFLFCVQYDKKRLNTLLSTYTEKTNFFYYVAELRQLHRNLRLMLLLAYCQ